MNVLLRSLDLHAGMDPALEAAFTSIIQSGSFRRKEYLLRERLPCRFIYFLTEGTVRHFTKTGSCEETTGFTRSPGFILHPEMFTSERSGENLQALNPCNVLFFAISDLIALANEFPPLQHVLMRLEILHDRRIRDQLKMLRMTKAEKRYQYALDAYPGIMLLVNNMHMASFIRCSVVTLSRIRSMGLHVV